jgi:hypothetical protein
MKVTKWVDFGQEVDVDIDATDIRCALAEAFAVVTRDRFEEDGPSRNDVLHAINNIGAFLKALTDEQIALLNEHQRSLTAEFLQVQADRFKLGGLFKPANAAVTREREAEAVGTVQCGQAESVES